jgi:two-component system, cell cycle sensor histidine kinase and response regulator CckA
MDREPRVSGRTGLLGAFSRREGESEIARLVVDRLPDPLVALDPAGRIRFGNMAFRGLAGPLARSLVMLLDEGSVESFRRALDRAFAGSAVGACPIALRLASGRAEFAASLDPLPEAAAVLVRLRGLATEQAADDSEHLAELGRLAGGVAHDFNNLLTGIVGAATHVLDHTEEPALREELAQVLSGARRGADLVRQLLAFASQQRLEARLVPMNDAVDGIARLLRRVLGTGIRLGVDLDLPGRWVRVDPAQLDQVIVNLAINARDAMPRGGALRLATGHATLLRPSRVGQSTVPAGRWVTLTVGDTGSGIPTELLPRIFEPFFTTRRERGGTGLGLATVLGIVRQSGGEITVDSAVGRGTTFTVWLPRHGAPSEAEAPPAAPPPPAEPEAGPATVEILLVEDEAPLRRLAERALLREGHRVSVAEDAEAALAAVEAGLRPDLVVSDVSMPGMDGVALAAALRARLPGVAILLVSGYAESMVGQDFSGAGHAFLPKPYTPRELAAAVQASLRAGG